MPITSFYAALLTVVFVALSVRTLRMRRLLGIAIGDAGNPRMLRAMRVHSNFAEYVPLSLVLMMLIEQQTTDAWLLHALGLCLSCGRLAHAYGVSQLQEATRWRVIGMAMTLTPLIISVLYLLFSATAAFIA